MAPDAKVEIEATLKDKASGAIGALRGKLQGLGSALGTVVRAGALAAGVAVLGLGAAAFQAGKDFEAAYNTIRVGTGATGEALAALKEDFKATLATVPSDMEAVATATADLNTRLGLTGPPLQAMSKQFLDLARITEQDVAPLIRDGTRVFGDWSIATDEQAAALDRLFQVSQATGIGVSDLSTKMVQFGAPLRQVGFDFEDATVLMGKWEKEGVNVEAILGALKMGVAKFAQEGVDAKEGMADFIATIQELGPGAEATSLAVEKFGSRAGPDMVAAVLEGRFALDELRQTINASGETIEKAGEDALTMGQRFSLLKNKVLVKLEPVIVSLFDKLDKGLTKVMPHVEDFIDTAINLGDAVRAVFTGDVEDGYAAFSKLPDSIKPVAEVLVTLATVVRDELAPAFKDGMEVIGPVVKDVFGFIIDNKPVMLAAIAAIGAAIVIALGPGAIAVAALLGIIYIVGKVKQNWGTLSAKFQEIVAEIDEHLGFLLDVFKGVWKDISNQVMFHVNLVWGIIKIVMALLKGDWSQAWEEIKSTASKLWGNIVGMVEGKVEVVKALVNGLKEPVKKAWEFILTQGINAMTLLWEGVKGKANDIIGVFNGMIGGIETAFNALAAAINAIPGFKAPGWVPGLGGKGWEIPDIPTIDISPIPTLHQGGDVLRTGAAIVHAGERVGVPVTLNFGPGSIQLGGAASRRDAEELVDMVERAIRDRRLRGV
jgi:phage-related minor tail protein